MRLYCYTFCFILLLNSCNNISSDTKKQIKKTGAAIAKQVKATAEHLDMVHDYIGFEAQADSGQIRLYWKDDKGNILGSLGNVKKFVEQQGSNLLYACNGGMYMQNQAPLGYYIQEGKTLQKINTKKGSGNFYLKPKAVFYVSSNNKPGIKSIETAADRALLQKENINYTKMNYSADQNSSKNIYP